MLGILGRVSSVGIATRYGLEGRGIESQWGRDFPHLSRPALSSTQPPIQWVTGLFPGGKAAGRGVDHPLQPSSEVKERVELHLYSPSGSSWTVLGWTVPLRLLGILPQIRRPGFIPTHNNNIVIYAQGTPTQFRGINIFLWYDAQFATESDVLYSCSL